MPQIFIDGQAFQARTDQTVLQAADEMGVYIPRLCWHPQLSVAGNCRICVVQIEGRSWVEISCNMPVSEGLRVLTDSAAGTAQPTFVYEVGGFPEVELACVSRATAADDPFAGAPVVHKPE